MFHQITNCSGEYKFDSRWSKFRSDYTYIKDDNWSNVRWVPAKKKTCNGYGKPPLSWIRAWVRVITRKFKWV